MEKPSEPRQLPPELWLYIVTFLPPFRVFELRRLNSTFWQLSLDGRYSIFDLSFQPDYDLDFINPSWRRRLGKLKALLELYRNKGLSQRVERIQVSPYLEYATLSSKPGHLRPLNSTRRQVLGKAFELLRLTPMSRGRLQARKVAAEIQASWVCFANVTTLEVRPLASRYFQQTRPIPKVCSYMENLFITFGNSLLHLILDFEGGDFNRRDILWANHHTLPQLVHLEVMIGSTGDREMMTCIQRLVSKSTRLETLHFRQAGFHPVLLSAWPLPADGEFHRLHSLSFSTGTRYGGNPTTIDPLVVCLTKFKGQIVHFASPRWFVDGPFSWMKASSLESLELALNKREAFLSLQAHLSSSQVKLRSLNLTFSHSFELRLSDLLGGFSTMSSLNSCTIYANAMNIGILSHLALSFPNLRTLNLSIWSRIDGQQSGASANEGDLLFKKFPYRELVREMQTMTNEPGFKSWALEDIRLELGRSTAWALMVEFARHVPSLVSFSGRGHKHCPSHSLLNEIRR